jgi:hypothetical protein
LPAALVSYELVIASERWRDGMAVINIGRESLPLAFLRLGEDRRQVVGGDWDVDQLKRGECVVMERRGGDDDDDDDDEEERETFPLPGDLECEEVGDRLRRAGSRLTSEEDFDVYYAGTLVGRCDRDEPVCPITITVQENN